MKRLDQNEPIVQLKYRGAFYTLSVPHRQWLDQNEAIAQLKYRGASYTLNETYHQTTPSIAFMSDSALADSTWSAVQIPCGFRYLLYRGKPYLAPCY